MRNTFPSAGRVVAILLSAAAAGSIPQAGAQAADTLPASLSNSEFWTLTQQLSEPANSFRAKWQLEQVLSNEKTTSTAAAQLAARVTPGGVYLGVGSEQNFTYIAASRPRIAIITDIRRGNLQLHLLYKAVFETTSNRTEFVGRLFGRKAARGITRRATARELMNAYLAAEPVRESEFESNLKSLQDHLTGRRRLPLSREDLDGIALVYREFHRHGPAVNYGTLFSGRSGDQGDMLSYASIVSLPDAASGAERSYLATEDNFAFVKALHNKNLIIPVVGDFAGKKALRAIGDFVRQHGAIVNVFYASNVVMWLPSGDIRQAFCANVAAMPLDESSLFVFGQREKWLVPMAATAASCFQSVSRSA